MNVQEMRKTVITAAGLGTRLLPATRELPKEMFPFCSYDSHGDLCTKPMIQLIYESLYSYGLRSFCFVVGRRKRSIEDFFTEDPRLLDLLSSTNNGVADQIREFFDKLKSCELSFVSQPEPLGFGDAILKSRYFVGEESFILHAGDDIIISQQNDHLRRLELAFSTHHASVACLLDRSEDPRQFGVVTGSRLGDGTIEIDSIEEKPVRPKSDMVVIAVYAFKPMVFDYILKAKKRVHSERELEVAMKMMLKDGHKFIGVKLLTGEQRIDIGNPRSYLTAMESLVEKTSPQPKIFAWGSQSKVRRSEADLSAVSQR